MDQWDYLGLVPKGVNADVDAVCWTNHFWFSSSSLTPRITTAWRKHWIRNHCPPLPPNRNMTAIQHKTKKTYSYNQKEIQQQKKNQKHKYLTALQWTNALNIQITGNYSIVNFSFQESGRFCLYKHIRLCYSITFREGKKYTEKSNDKQLNSAMNILHLVYVILSIYSSWSWFNKLDQ